MNIKTTFILVAVLAVVLGVVWFTQSGSKPVEEQTVQRNDAAGKPIFDIQQSHVIGLSITDAQGNRTQLTKTNGSWRLTSPVDAPATEWSVGDLISAIIGVRSQG